MNELGKSTNTFTQNSQKRDEIQTGQCPYKNSEELTA
jgi:hypothetical protein